MITKILFFISKENYFRSISLIFLLLIGTILEIIGIGMIYPLVSLLADYQNFIENISNYSALYKIILKFTYFEIQLFSIIIFLTFYLLKTLYLIFLSYFQSYFVYNLKKKLSSDIFNLYIYQNYEFFLLKSPEEFTRNCTNEIDEVIMSINYFINIILELCILLSLLSLLFLLSFSFTIIIIIFVIFLLILFRIILLPSFNKWGLERQNYSSLVYKQISESFGSIRIAKLSNIEKIFSNSFQDFASKLINTQFKSTFFQSIPKIIIELILILFGSIFLIYLLLLNYSFTTILPIMSVYLVATLRLMPSITRIISYGNSLKFSFNAIILIYDEFKKFKISNNHNKVINDKIIFQDKLLIKDLTFRYNQSSKYIFKNLNFEITKGQIIGIFGKSGEGKSTFVDLISGLLTPEKGNVIIDNKILNSENSKNWQSQFSYSPQNIYLFDESVLTNIVLNFDKSLNYDEKKLFFILSKLDLDEFVNNLPYKINTNIGSLGKKISGGQKQRIGIARTLMQNKDFLIFDESTSSLDKENQDNVFKLLEYLNKDKSMTIIIISHQLEVLNKCNKVYELFNSKFKLLAS